MPATILSLPNELLEAIFEEALVHNSTYLALSTTCTRLQLFFLSIYIKKVSNGPEDRLVASIPSRSINGDLIAALHLSGLVAKTERLCCDFPSGQISLKTMLFHFDRVERLVSRMAYVKEVVLNFHEKPYGDPSEADILSWSDGIGKLLNAILERGCVSLEVNGLAQMIYVYRGVLIMPHQPSNSFLTHIKTLFTGSANNTSKSKPNVLSGPTWKYQRISKRAPSILTELSPQAQARSTLSHLTIGSKSLLCPPLLQWTVSVLSTSPIQTLTIRNIDFLRTTWTILTAVLSHAIPTLQRLEIADLGSLSQHHSEITNLMSAFQELRYLSAELLGVPWYTTLLGAHNFKTTPITFPHFAFLTDLRVSDHWILPYSYFESYVTVEAFPSLRNLTLILEGSMVDSPARALLAKLSERGSRLHFNVNLEFLVGGHIERAMRLVWYEQPSEDQASQTWIRCVSGVGLLVKARLEFEVDDYAKSSVEEWFGKFVGRKRVSVRSKVMDPEVEGSVEAFCRFAMSGVLKGVEYVEVNGKAWKGTGLDTPHSEGDLS